MIDYNEIRIGLAGLDASASHSASGEDRPQLNEIFAPEHHAGALDPNATIVLGARGAGKSFWAGVLAEDELRLAASKVYPNLSLDRVVARIGYSGLSNDGSVSKATLDHQLPVGAKASRISLFWRCVMVRAFRTALHPNEIPEPVGELLNRYSDPERLETDLAALNKEAERIGQTVVVIFDALDGLAVDWQRLRNLIDALLEVAWEIRGYRTIRCKLFLRPDQTTDLGLRFVELPKLLSGATHLNWNAQDLYGMFFVRLGSLPGGAHEHVKRLFNEENLILPSTALSRLRRWSPAYDKKIQARLFSILAGPYMGRSNKKGRTFDWTYNHLVDGHGEATPRSFMTLMIEAARVSPPSNIQALSADGIRAGLRAASRTRVNQLDVEFPWIKRVLAPLSRLQVPSSIDAIKERWAENKTIQAVYKRAREGDFLPPFESQSGEAQEEALIARLVRIGVLVVRNDGRYDMPDLFRVAARLLKKGGVAPN